MKRSGTDAKSRIYQAVMTLLADGEDAEQLSVRQIAAKAGVNLALVNYYYTSKENLLGEVVGEMMGSIIARASEDGGGAETAGSKLRNILIATADTAFVHRNICGIAIAAELKKGCENSCAMVRPFLAEMLVGYGKDDLDVVSMQLMLPFHHIVLEPEMYGRLLDTDFYDKRARDIEIDRMIACVLAKQKEG